LYHVYCFDIPLFVPGIRKYLILEADESIDDKECNRVISDLSKISEHNIKTYFRHDKYQDLNYIAGLLKVSVVNLRKHPLVKIYSFKHSNRVDGMYCVECGTFCYMGAPNRDNGTIVCWGCDNGWNG